MDRSTSTSGSRPKRPKVLFAALSLIAIVIIAAALFFFGWYSRADQRFERISLPTYLQLDTKSYLGCNRDGGCAPERPAPEWLYAYTVKDGISSDKALIDVRAVLQDKGYVMYDNPILTSSLTQAFAKNPTTVAITNHEPSNYQLEPTTDPHHIWIRVFTYSVD